jgi:hypothetical protein
VAPTIGGGGNSPLTHSKKARAKPRCSICKSLEHNKRKCPQKNIVSDGSTAGADGRCGGGSHTSSGRSLDQPRGKPKEVVVVRRHRRRRAMFVRASATSDSSDNSDGSTAGADGRCGGGGSHTSSGRSLDQPRGKPKEVVVVRRHRRRRAMFVRASTTSDSSDNSDDGLGVDGVGDGSFADAGPSSRRSSARLRGEQSAVSSLWDLEDPKCL